MLPLVAVSAWQSLVVAVLVLATVRLFRRWPARLRSALLGVAVIKFLVLPAAAPTPPTPPSQPTTVATARL